MICAGIMSHPKKTETKQSFRVGIQRALATAVTEIVKSHEFGKLYWYGFVNRHSTRRNTRDRLAMNPSAYPIEFLHAFVVSLLMEVHESDTADTASSAEENPHSNLDSAEVDAPYQSSNSRSIARPKDAISSGAVSRDIKKNRGGQFQ